MEIRVVSVNPAGKPVAHAAFLCLRSFLKMLALYLFNGIPFIICCITMFTNSESRSGFDMAAKTYGDPADGRGHSLLGVGHGMGGPVKCG